jgi:hypothetical protein
VVSRDDDDLAALEIMLATPPGQPLPLAAELPELRAPRRRLDWDGRPIPDGEP